MRSEWKGTPAQDPDNLMAPKTAKGNSQSFKLIVTFLVALGIGFYLGWESAWYRMGQLFSG